MRSNSSPRAAVVHDFFVTEGGADRVAIEFANMLGDAQVFTSFFDSRRFGSRIDPGRVHSWPVQRILGPTPRFRYLLPVYPVYFSLLKPPATDLILSSSIAFSKAVRRRSGALHITYVHTPMRYAWDLDTYLEGSSQPLFARIGAQTIRPLLKHWDRLTSRRPDVIVANSRTVQLRIKAYWGRDAEVIYPPVSVADIPVSKCDDGYFLIAARMLHYRRLDIAVEACRELQLPLVLVGTGPEEGRLRQLAGPQTRFEGFVSRERLVALMANCRAYLVPGIEDFGIAPVEAMAAGKPVIAFRGGGATESVIDRRTGLFFDEQSAQSLADVLQKFDVSAFSADACRAQAERFSLKRFRSEWTSLMSRHGVDPALWGG